MHVMIDLETMGTRPNAPIVSIGAVMICRGVVYDHHGFYKNIDIESAVSAGGVIAPSTVMWWLRQSKTAQDALSDTQDEAVPVGEALDMFEGWLRDSIMHIDGGTDLSGIKGIWGNGATFDNVLLRETYARLGRDFPLPFWLDKCYRTVKGAHPDVVMDRCGTHHNALDDARAQARHLVEIDQSAGGVYL